MNVSAPAIDFLPPSYGDRRRRHRTGRWHGTVAVAFAGLIAAGLAGNRLHHARLVAKRDLLRPQAESIEAVESRIALSRDRMAASVEKADLRAALRLRPSTTRWLAAVTAPLPSEAALTELQFLAEPPAEPSPADAETKGLKPDPAAIATGSILTVRLRGVAWDDEAVSDYLDGLTRTGEFESVRLDFVDRHEIHGRDLRGFSLSLTLRATRLGDPVPGPDQASVSASASREGGLR